MGNTTENRFTVHQRLAASEARLTALETENKQLRQWVLGELTSKINDAKNVIQDSIRIPQDGRDGRDGATGAQGIQGERGDVLYISPAEVSECVRALRRKLKEKHAAHIAVIVERLEYEKSQDSWVNQHFAGLLESLKRDIERLR